MNIAVSGDVSTNSPPFTSNTIVTCLLTFIAAVVSALLDDLLIVGT